MVRLCLALVPLAFVLSLIATRVVRAVSERAGAHDTAPMPGQVKEAVRRVPNTGGIGIFLGIALPMLALLAFLAPANIDPHDWNLVPADLHEHLAGLKSKAMDAVVLLGGLAVLHVLGIWDDRRPMGPLPKFAVMTVVAGLVVVLTHSRILTLLDGYVGGNDWLSVLVTVVWIVGITNAMNFLDNMDGLAAGVATAAGACFLWAALASGQWFVGACLALLVGACMGFLVYNFPWRGAKGRGATIFMGDGGSLLLGFLLAFLSVRLTYARVPGPGVVSNGAWYGVLMPIAALAVPVYDMITVTCIRISQGRSPFVGDLNHLSHRLVRRGLSKRASVVVIYAFATITGLCGVLLLDANKVQAGVIGAMVAMMMVTLAVIEFGGANGSTGVQSPPARPGDRGGTA